MIEIKLDELLKDKNRSLYWVHKQSGISYNLLFKLRKNKANSITFPILEKICNLLECTPGDLLVIVKDEAETEKG